MISTKISVLMDRISFRQDTCREYLGNGRGVVHHSSVDGHISCPHRDSLLAVSVDHLEIGHYQRDALLYEAIVHKYDADGTVSPGVQLVDSYLIQIRPQRCEARNNKHIC